MNRDILCIAKYIYAYLQGTISEEELLELEEWKNNSEVNKQLFERLLKTSFIMIKLMLTGVLIGIIILQVCKNICRGKDGYYGFVIVRWRQLY